MARDIYPNIKGPTAKPLNASAVTRPFLFGKYSHPQTNGVRNARPHPIPLKSPNSNQKGRGLVTKLDANTAVSVIPVPIKTTIFGLIL